MGQDADRTQGKKYWDPKERIWAEASPVQLARHHSVFQAAAHDSPGTGVAQLPLGPPDWFPSPCLWGQAPADAMAVTRMCRGTCGPLGGGGSRDSLEGGGVWGVGSASQRKSWQAPLPKWGKCADSSSRMAASRWPWVNREGNRRLSSAFARTPPKPCCPVCRTLGRQPVFPNLSETQAGRLGTSYRQTAVLSNESQGQSRDIARLLASESAYPYKDSSKSLYEGFNFWLKPGCWRTPKKWNFQAQRLHPSSNSKSTMGEPIHPVNPIPKSVLYN